MLFTIINYSCINDISIFTCTVILYFELSFNFLKKKLSTVKPAHFVTCLIRPLFLFFLIHNACIRLKSVHLLVHKHRIWVPSPGLVIISGQCTPFLCPKGDLLIQVSGSETYYIFLSLSFIIFHI